MAIDGAALGSMIHSSLAASSPPTNDAELTNFCNALGQAIASYLKANAVVMLNPDATVTTGAGAGGTVTGTGKLT